MLFGVCLSLCVIHIDFPAFSDISCRSRLAKLNENLTALEQRVEYIEARVSILNILCCNGLYY